jgi:hypothetical protein
MSAAMSMKGLLSHGAEVFECFSGREDGTLWYYHALSQPFGSPAITPISLTSWIALQPKSKD